MTRTLFSSLALGALVLGGCEVKAKTQEGSVEKRLEVQAEQSDFVVKKSPFDFEDTVESLRIALQKKDITIMAQVDHHENAEGVDMELRPTTLLIFGNPKIGTQLMQDNQRYGLQLPMKILVWEDATGQVWMQYQKPESFGRIYGDAEIDDITGKMSKALDDITDLVAR